MSNSNPPPKQGGLSPEQIEQIQSWQQGVQPPNFSLPTSYPYVPHPSRPGMQIQVGPTARIPLFPNYPEPPQARGTRLSAPFIPRPQTQTPREQPVQRAPAPTRQLGVPPAEFSTPTRYPPSPSPQASPAAAQPAPPRTKQPGAGLQILTRQTYPPRPALPGSPPRGPMPPIPPRNPRRLMRNAEAAGGNAMDAGGGRAEGEAPSRKDWEADVD